jgi:hypothetical protein
MNCEEFAHQSEEWMEGRRSNEARSHAMICEQCRAFVEDLDAIRLLAPQLAWNAEPPETLWNSIHAQLEKEGLIRRPAWTSRGVRWMYAWRGPLAAAAAAAVLAIGFFAFTFPSRVPRPPVPAGRVWLSADQPELDTVDAQLDHVERGQMASLESVNPEVQDTLKENLMIVDRQIARCEKSLEEAPSDENTRDYLYDAYQEKADLLTMMAERGSEAAE